MKRMTIVLLAGLLLAGVAVGGALGGGVLAARNTVRDDKEGTGEQWEYLIVAGGNVNLSSSSNPSLRKQEAFSRESFPLEQNLDKLGAKGWELVAVTGPPNDPGFVLKRRK